MTGETQFPLEIARQGTFFVVGEYRQGDPEQYMAGKMYVEYQIPAKQTHPYPIVMMHGGGQTGNNFRSTPDGRPGWADYFLSWGYAVYVIDQVGRGRSGLSPDLTGSTTYHSAENLQRRFTASKSHHLWPQAPLHTQWPGDTGQMGDPAFDQYYASTVPFIADQALGEALNLPALIALFERIGPAIIMVHSQAGMSGWRIGDARPALVKGIVAVEPNGPPYCEVEYVGPPDYFVYPQEIARPHGISRGHLTFDPPVTPESPLACMLQSEPDAPDLVRGWLQVEPARKLVNLAGIPIVILAGESSYHAPYDHVTSKFLTQAGVANTFIRLEDVGIRGNGHMMMLEKNNGEVAKLISDWLDAHVR